MSSIKAIGIDLAKLVFSIHGVDAHDKCKYRKTVKRNNLLAEVAKLLPCIIGMEACSSANHQGDSVTKLINAECRAAVRSSCCQSCYCLTKGSPCSSNKRRAAQERVLA